MENQLVFSQFWTDDNLTNTNTRYRAEDLLIIRLNTYLPSLQAFEYQASKQTNKQTGIRYTVLELGIAAYLRCFPD